MRPLPSSALLAGLAFPLALAAQTAVQLPRTSVEETVRLDPFMVKTSEDTSYGALNSNSITRFNTELDKVPISADIFTEKFMEDVDATDVNSLLSSYGAGMGMVYANPTTDSNLTQAGDRPLFGDRFTPPQIGTRGLSAGNIRVDGFASVTTNTNSTSNFDIERVEVLRGPQGLLYGAGGAGGTIVITSKQAQFGRTFGRLYEKIDEYGSKYSQADFNVGAGWVAARVALLDNDNRTRRLFIGNKTDGVYAQLAFALPLKTILRTQFEYTRDRRTQPQNINVNFGSATADPRNGDSLEYLLATNQAGAINPATGQAFSSFGAIDNGNLSWNNYSSFAGWHGEEQYRNTSFEATADTVWTPWLSTTMGARFNHSVDFGNITTGNVSTLTAPGVAGNPTGTWAVNTSMNDTVNVIENRAARISALITKDFGETAKTQTVLGYDYDFRGQGPVDYYYYLSDASGNLILNGTNNLGRTAMPAQWWPVGNGPVYNGVAPLGSPVIQGADGKYYVRAVGNPKNPAWISPTNPFGTATVQFPGTGVTGGLNYSDYEFFRYWDNAYYAANYTRWFDDWVATLAGFRSTTTTTPIGSGGNFGTPSQTNHSWNLGADGRILSWLRWYYSYSSTFNNSQGFNDPIGDLPPTSHAKGQEVGLKFNPFQSRISGSLAYYSTKAYQQNTNIPITGNFYELINPTGLDGIYRGPNNTGRNNWVPLDQKSSGLELILTANPTPNWRIRIAATHSDGRVEQASKFQFVYNDQFYTDGKGNVTYKDGSPFLVPTNVAVANGLTKVTDPATALAGQPTMQLTTAMLGDPNSDYYAWGKGNPANLNGQINSGLGTTSPSAAGNVLRYFQKPGGITPLTGALGLPITAIQYAWPDPGKTGGFYTVSVPGDLTVGYPVYMLSIVNSYEFDHGPLKGLGLVFALNNSWQNRTFYYQDPAGRRFFSAPEVGWQVNLYPYYQHKFGRVLWRTQLDITNLFNHYAIYLTPNSGFGFTRPSSIGVGRQPEPRLYAWSNTFSF